MVIYSLNHHPVLFPCICLCLSLCEENNGQPGLFLAQRDVDYLCLFLFVFVFVSVRKNIVDNLAYFLLTGVFVFLSVFVFVPNFFLADRDVDHPHCLSMTLSLSMYL